MSHHNIALTHRDEEVLVGYEILPAEPDVGIMAPYISHLWFENEDGTVNVEATSILSPKEIENLREQIYNQLD